MLFRSATGEKTFQSLLVSVNVGPGEEGGTDINISFGDGLLTQAIGSLVNTKKESKMFTEDPEEAVLFADSEPEAAVVEPQPAADPVEEPEPAGEPDVTEEDFDPDL